ncbi:MAG: ectoine hydroxylase-related dioxygenase (phytanoyl-CoA dioxygenase family) [Bacteriovoracaceae bacterium]
MATELNTDTKKFDELGYVVIKNFFNKDEAKNSALWLRDKDLKSMVKSWTDQEPMVDLAVWQNVHHGDDPIAKLVGDPKILDVAENLIKNKVYIWSSKVNLKAAWCGTVEYHHQDFVYWRQRGYQEINMLTCVVFLDDHSVNNGGLNIFPGSHNEGFIEHEPFVNINGLQKFMIPPSSLDELNKKYPVTVVEAEPGDVLFFHSALIHGSAHNISPNPRMIALAQLNTVGNLPDNVQENTKKYNLWRTEYAAVEARKRLAYYEEKYLEQSSTKEILYNSPIQKKEKE